MGILLGCVLGSMSTVGSFAVARLLSRPSRVISPEREAMRAAVHSATTRLPYLRIGLAHDSARQSIVHLTALTQAPCVTFADETAILAVAREGCDAFRIGGALPTWLVPRREDRLLVERRVTKQAKGLTFDSAGVVPPIVRGSRAGNQIAVYRSDQRLQSEDTRVVSETGAQIAAELELTEIKAPSQHLALAELRGLRHPDIAAFHLERARGSRRADAEQSRPSAELRGEFAHSIRYAFRGQQPYVTPRR